MRKLLLVLWLLCGGYAQAATWTLQDVYLLDDSGNSVAVTGSFTYADGIYSDIDILVEPHPDLPSYWTGVFTKDFGLPDNPYSVGRAFSGGPNWLRGSYAQGGGRNGNLEIDLYLNWEFSLDTFAGTQLGLGQSSFRAGICSSGCMFSHYSEVDLSLNPMIVSDVPLPAAALFFLSAIGGLGILKRARK